MAEQLRIKTPKNYKESSILEFFSDGRKQHKNYQTLMFMLNPEPGETFVPVTTYIPGNIKKNPWLFENMYYTDQQFMLLVCSVLSHENVHLALSRNIGIKECDKLDPIFGISWFDTYEDVHGLLNFDNKFKPRKNKIKGWKTKWV